MLTVVDLLLCFRVFPVCSVCRVSPLHPGRRVVDEPSGPGISCEATPLGVPGRLDLTPEDLCQVGLPLTQSSFLDDPPVLDDRQGWDGPIVSGGVRHPPSTTPKKLGSPRPPSVSGSR